MANIKNLKPFTSENAKEMGRKGGIASGITRRRKKYIRKQMNTIIKLQEYIDSLSNVEYKEFIIDFSKEQQEYIRRIFKPTIQETKRLLKK